MQNVDGFMKEFLLVMVGCNRKTAPKKLVEKFKTGDPLGLILDAALYYDFDPKHFLLINACYTDLGTPHKIGIENDPGLRDLPKFIFIGCRDYTVITSRIGQRLGGMTLMRRRCVLQIFFGTVRS